VKSKRSEKVKNYFKRFLRLNKFADSVFSSIYLSIILTLVCLGLFIYHSMKDDIYIYVVALVTSSLLIVFFLGNSKKNRDSHMLDHGMMPYPFSGLEVESFLSGPGNEIKRKGDKYGAPIALISWLYFAVSAVVKSRENQYQYHIQLVNSIKDNAPEMLDWLGKMYEILDSEPPLPEQLTTEDFDMYFGDL